MTMRDNVTSREHVNLALRRQEADRIPRAESFWPETLPAWQQEGMPYGQSPDELFDYDIVQAGWVESRAFPGFEEIIREDAESVVRRDGNAAILRYWKHHSGTPEHIGFEVDGPDAWPRLRDGFRDIPIGQRVDLCSTVRAMIGIRLVYDIANVSGPSASIISERMLRSVATNANPARMLAKNGSLPRAAASVCGAGTRIWIVHTVATRYIAACR